MTTQNPRSRRSRLRSLLVAPVVGIALGAGGLLPLSAAIAHAGDNDYTQWEDCDWDGYDDHTGVKVPWPGFDGTKGDTPSGPSENSQTGKKQASASASPTPTSSASASSGSTTGKGSSSKSSTASPKKKASSTASATASAKPQPSASGSPTARASHQPSATPTPSASLAGSPATLSLQGDGRVVAGASVTISGSGFEPGQDGLSISLQSVPGELATVTADASGGFETTVQLPADVPAGAQTLSVTHDGAQLTSLGVDVAEPLAAAAATDASPSPISEQVAGAALLAGLAVSGGGAVAVSSLVRRRNRGR